MTATFVIKPVFPEMKIKTNKKTGLFTIRRMSWNGNANGEQTVFNFGLVFRGLSGLFPLLIL